MKFELIKPTNGFKIIGDVEIVTGGPLVFLMHGLGSSRIYPHIQGYKECFGRNGFTIVTFDTTCAVGESGGNYEDVTVESSLEDLILVTDWASTQSWYQEPFWLVGHSPGGLCSLLFAIRYPKKVIALAPIATVVSGQLRLQAPKIKKLIAEGWQKRGYFITTSRTLPGLEKKLNWGYMESEIRHNVLADADKISVPVLLIVGDQDESTPAEHVRLLYNSLVCPRELHLIKGSPHTPTGWQLVNVKKIMNKWIRRVAEEVQIE